MTRLLMSGVAVAALVAFGSMADAQQQQQLVAAVCERMHGLRQHGARAGDEGGYALRGEDREVRAERKQDGAIRIALACHSGPRSRTDAEV